MAIQTYSMLYGNSKKEFQMDDKHVQDIVKIANYPAIEEPEKALREAMNNPIGCDPLNKIVKAGETVCIIINDTTRIAQTPIIVKAILEELHAIGTKDEDIWFIAALGTHRAMTHEEFVHELGEDVVKKYKVINSDAKKKEDFEFFGTTSRGTEVGFHKEAVKADHIICTGSVLYHFFAGYGGGRKAMLPGISYFDTIQQNHSLMLDPTSEIGVLDGNPVYEDQIEGVMMYPPSFIINVVLDADHRFLGVFAGHFIKAHKTACKFVDKVYGAEIESEADIVIVSCGGYPKDINVYQMQKTLNNAYVAVKKGGVVIMIAQCSEGSGSKALEEAFNKLKTAAAIEKSLKEEFVVGKHKAWSVSRLTTKAEYMLVSDMEADMVRSFLLTPKESVEEALASAFEKMGSDAKVILMPDGSYTVPCVTKKG